MSREHPIEIARVRAALDEVVRIAKTLPLVWNTREPTSKELNEHWSGDITIEQWLRWWKIPECERILANDGPWPASSSGGARVAGTLSDHAHLEPLYKPLAALDELLETNGNPAAFAYKCAVEAFHAGDFEGSTRIAEDALALQNNFPNAAHVAGWALVKKPNRTTTDLERAIAFFEDARALAPNEPDPLIHLADALVDAKRQDDAIAAMTKATTESATRVHAHNWLGWYAKKYARDLPRAIEHFETALRARSWGVAWLNYARTLDESSRTADAYVAYGCALIAGSFDDALAQRRKTEIGDALEKCGKVPFDPARWLGGVTTFEFVEAMRAVVEGRANESHLDALASTAKSGWGASALQSLAKEIHARDPALAVRLQEMACEAYEVVWSWEMREPTGDIAQADLERARATLAKWK